MKKLVFLFVLLMIGNLVTGEVIFIENFDYPIGEDLTGHGWTAHSGAGTNPITVTNGLSFPGYAGSGIGGAALADANGEDVHISIGTEISLGTTYISFLVKVNSLYEGYFFHIGPTNIGSNYYCRVFMLNPSNGGDFKFGLSMSGAAATGSTSYDCSFGVTYLLVMKYEMIAGAANDEVSLYVFQSEAPGSEPDVPAIGPQTGTDINNFGTIAIRQYNNSQNVIIDGIRVGTSWDDAPLPVTLSSFTAGIDAGLPVLWWTTESEQENMGWNLYRSNEDNGINANNFLQLNETLIPGMGTTTQPTSYYFVDEHNIAAPGTYWYWLQSVSFSGELEMFGPVSLQIGEGGIPDLPQYSSLQANYPNPFNPVTTIEFSIREGDNGTLTIYNIAGQKILEKEYPAGNHLFQWNADDQASGVYFYQLRTPSFYQSRKMIMIK